MSDIYINKKNINKHFNLDHTIWYTVGRDCFSLYEKYGFISKCMELNLNKTRLLFSHKNYQVYDLRKYNVVSSKCIINFKTILRVK